MSWSRLAANPPTFYLYECVVCGTRTLLTPSGGDINDCPHVTPENIRCTPLDARPSELLADIHPTTLKEKV